MIQRTKITVTDAVGATGTGDATANASSSDVISGTIYGVYLEYTDSPPAATTDVTVAEKTQSPAVTVMTVPNAATDGWFYPMFQATDKTGALISGQYFPCVVDDHIKVTIAQVNNNDGVIATIIWCPL